MAGPACMPPALALNSELENPQASCRAPLRLCDHGASFLANVLVIRIHGCRGTSLVGTRSLCKAACLALRIGSRACSG